MDDSDRSKALEAFVENAKAGAPGDLNHRAYVGPPDQYDFMGATQFRLVTALGLRETHHYLDVGCGSLRAGKFVIQYLLPGRYHGIEPNHWLIEDAVAREIGQDVLQIKVPRFSDNNALDFTCFGRRFDFIVAQSIFSHTGRDLLSAALRQVREAGETGCQLLFTAVTRRDPGADNMADGTAAEGWVYPECVRYDASEIESLCADHNLFVQKLDWFHPRQTWFRVVLEREELLSPDQSRAIGNGAVLFDPRFPGR